MTSWQEVDPILTLKNFQFLFFFFSFLWKKLKEFILDMDISLHQCFDLVNKQTNQLFVYLQFPY